MSCVVIGEREGWRGLRSGVPQEHHKLHKVNFSDLAISLTKIFSSVCTWRKKRYKTIPELNIGLDTLCPWGGGGRSHWRQMFLPSFIAGTVPEAAEQGAELPCAGCDCVSHRSSAVGIYGIIGTSGFWHGYRRKALQRQDGSSARAAEWDC